MIFLLLSVFVVWFCVPKQVRAAQNIAQTEASQQEELLSDLPLSDIQKVLEQNTDTQDLTFRELVRQLMQDGEYTDKRTLVRQVFDRAFGDVAEGKQLFVQILLLTAACSFLQNFIHVFENSQISKTGFYLYFLLLMGLLLRSYLLIHGILEDVLGQVIDFMEALLPAFCMTMVFCSQKVTAVGFYQLSLIVIYLIDRVLLYIVIPAIHVYVVLQMLNCMTEEKLISRMTVLLKRGLIWVMRLLLAGVTGMNVIERMIAPSVDNLKKMSVTQTISMLPGLGNTAQAVGNIFLSYDADIIIGGELASYLEPRLQELKDKVNAYPVLAEETQKICVDVDSVNPMAEGAALTFVSQFLNNELEGFRLEDIQ